MRPLPESFIRRVIDVHGAEGAAWLAALPALLDEFAAKWEITIENAVEPLSYGYVAPAVRADGALAMVKTMVAGDIRNEIACMRAWDGRGAARVLESESERGVLLLERLVPGVPLFDVEDEDESTRIVAGVIRDLWFPVPPGHDFATVEGWAKGFDRLRECMERGELPFPLATVARATELHTHLLATSAPPVLLHGDLHHWNVLQAGDRWLAIDPKGVVGEPAYEVGAWLRNPGARMLDWPDMAAQQARRVAILGDELGIERERVAAWGYSQAILSIWWTYEDHHEVNELGLAIADSLEPMLPS